MIIALLISAILTVEPIQDQTPEQITHTLQQLRSQDQSFEERVRTIANSSIGTEYNNGPLGEGVGGKHDSDPLVDLKRVDCVTFVEQTIALSVTPSYEEMVDFLQTIRYKDAKIDYEHRNHFMISDWVPNNPFFHNITGDLGVETETVTRTISRKDFFKRVDAPTLGQTTPDQSISVRIIPTPLTAQAEAQLPDTALIIFIGKVDWLFALHCGLYIRDENGKGFLLHASSKNGHVAQTNLTHYMEPQKNRYLGFTAYTITEPE
jgi:hypothetical protein